MTKDDVVRLAREAGLPDPMVFAIAYQRFAALVAAAPQPTRAANEAQSECEPSYTSRKLAEMVMSDCGHSTNNQRLLDRIAERIEKHTESVRAELAAAPQPQPEQEPFAYYNPACTEIIMEAAQRARYMQRTDGHAQSAYAKACTEPLYTNPQAQPAQPLTDEQKAVLNFLLGASDLDGAWFGDQNPKESGAFWWRDRLRKAFQENRAITKGTP